MGTGDDPPAIVERVENEGEERRKGETSHVRMQIAPF